MEIGFVGLGRMGGNMALRLLKRGHRVVAFDLSAEAVKRHAAEGAVGASTWEAFVGGFEDRPRIMWIMVPAGDPTTQAINQLIELGDPGDIIVDGGNTNWKIALDDCARVRRKGMHYMDAGTSGGIWGQEYGYCLMVGAEQEIYDRCLPILKDLAPDDGGLVRTGNEGSGHFVKMVHNGVEYGLMQAYAEGFQVMKMSRSFPGMDMRAIAEAWRTGSVVRSWLLDLIARGLSQDPELTSIKGWVEDTGEGRWTVEAAIDESVPTPVIAESLFARFRSRMENTFGDRVLAAFLDSVSYIKVDFSRLEDFKALGARLQELDNTRLIPGNRIFYCATPPPTYELISVQIQAAGLSTSTGFRRIVIEKPFGLDLKSARGLTETLHKVFSEDSVYRIDHYLGKETVQNILAFRFANAIFEPVWNPNLIDSVQITVAEDIGIETRGADYDRTGAR